MKTYHANHILTSPAWESLIDFLDRCQGEAAQAQPDFERFERELHAQMLTLERMLVADRLTQYDVTVSEITVQGVVYQRSGVAPETYLTAVGPVTIERHVYRVADHQTRHVCPLEMRVGIVEGFFTPTAARQVAYVTAQMPPREGEGLFREIGNMQPSTGSLERLPKNLSTHWEKHRLTWETQLRRQEKVVAEAATLAVSLDGVMAPMRPGPDAPEKQAGSESAKQPKGPKGYQEVGCGTVSLYNAEGQRLQTVRYGRQPERKKVTLCQQLQSECQAILAVRPRLKLVRLADGARENWRFLESLDVGLPPDQVETWDIVDFYHACDHLKRATDLVWGEFSPKGKAEFVRLKTLLKEMDGGVETLIAALRYRVRCASKAKRSQLRTELNYFRNQRHRMDYAAYLRQNLPIASGVVEAACKTLVTQRLKQSGMRWSGDGAQAILTLRSLIQSGRWEHGWALLRANYQQTVLVGANSAYSALPCAG